MIHLALMMGVEGVVDYAAADSLDDRWWGHFFRRLLGYSYKHDRGWLKAQQDHTLARVASDGLTEESWKSAAKSSDEQLFALHNSYHPWKPIDAETLAKDDMAALRQLYAEKIGDANDPRLQARIDEEVARLQAIKPRASEATEDVVEAAKFLQRQRERRKALRRS